MTIGVLMTIFRSALIFCLLFLGAAANAQTCAAPGVDGPAASLSGIVNTYHAGSGSASAGTNQVTVASITGQRTSNRSIAAGDLILIMQMQDSSAPANAGQYEYALVTSVLGNVLTLNRLLTSNYTQSVTAAGGVTTNWRTFQVVRVPQHASATVAAGNTVTADRWTVSNVNGQGTGGIVAIDVAGSTTVNGTISVNGAGFRGSAGVNGTSNRAGGLFNDANYNFQVGAVNGALKGEGTVGTPFQIFNGTATRLLYATVTFGQGYAGGAAGQGAQGNAAGGANDGSPTAVGSPNQQNSGGGGGGNAGLGGQGGNSWPTSTSVASGGRGGGAVTNSITRLVLGGGGGSGSANGATAPDAVTLWPPSPTSSRSIPPTTGTVNGATGAIMLSGASGGGVVLLRTGGLTAAAGVITARGYDAYNINSAEGAGGGGAGGGIYVTSLTGNGAGLTLNASGGGGGYSGWFDHGPGGGGGGGFVATSANLTGATTNITGGTLGYDGCCGGNQGNGSPKAYGSGVGAVGVLIATGGSANGTGPGAACLPQLTVTKITTTPLITLPGGTTAQYSINVTNLATAGAAYGVSVRDIFPPPFGLQTITATGASVFSGTNTTGLSPTASNQSGNTTTAVFGFEGRGNTPTVSSYTVFAGGSVTVTFVVNLNTTTLATFQNSASVTFSDPTRLTGGSATNSGVNNPVVSPGGTYASGATVGGSNYASASSTAEDVRLVATTTLTVTKSNSTNTVTAGGTTSYILTFSNTGGFAANNSIIRDVVGTGLVCNTVTCTSASGGASCPAGLTLNTPVAASSVPNFFNATGLSLAIFPASGSVVIKVDCSITATGL